MAIDNRRYGEGVSTMKIKDKAKPPIPPLPGGSYLGTCVYSIDIGEQLC